MYNTSDDWVKAGVSERNAGSWTARAQKLVFFILKATMESVVINLTRTLKSSVYCSCWHVTCCVGISSKETLIKWNIATDLFDGWKIRSSIHLPGSLMKTIFYLPLLNLSWSWIYYWTSRL